MVCLKQLIDCITHCYKKGEIIMTIALKIGIIVMAAVLALPIEYIFFPKLDRQEKEYNRLSIINFGTIALVIMLIVVSIAISYCSLFWNKREIWYLYLIPMACPIFFQFIFACTNLQKKLLPLVLPILAIAFVGCIMLPIRDCLLVYEPEVSSSYIEVNEQPILSEEQIKARLNASYISESSYNNDEGKYIYEIYGGESGYGLALVDAQKMEFLPCKYENQISGIVREHYPKEEIVGIGICFQRKNGEKIPYAKFGILKRPHIFSKPEIDFYVLLNMKSGEITERSK